MKDLTREKPIKVIIDFAVPICIGSLFQLFYSLVDTRIVGSTLGLDALAAVGATTTLNSLIVGFLIGLTSGFSVITAQSFGAEDYNRVRKSTASSFILGLAISVFLTIVSVGGLTSILKWLNMPEEHFEQGYSYILIILAGMTASMLYNICASILRAIGDTITPLCFLIFSTVLNIFLDYVFIVPASMGVAGAALATVLSQLLSGLLNLGWILFR
ncbi:MAG: MATE family efflux transporter, partial [Alistipes sp.]|nr:MATE family efflux transporter [Alistipes sp.]